MSTTSFGGGAFPELPGAAVDIRHVAVMLKERGFEIRLVGSESSPTVDDVIAALSKIVDQTQPDDLGAIYLAGHGYRTRDDNGDEVDGWDETFVCADGALRDDWFRDGLWPRARAGARFVVVVDACHSDSMTLGLRAADPPEVTPIARRGRDFYRLVLAACRDEERTLEVVADDRGGGIVTTAMLDALHRDSKLTYADLWSHVAKDLQTTFRERFRQEPHLSSSGPDDSLLRSPAFLAR